MVARHAAREDREEERIRQLERSQYEKKMQDPKKDDGDSTTESKDESNSTEDYSGAYLTPNKVKPQPTKAPVKAPPKAVKMPPTKNELLSPIPEDQTKEDDDEEIEVVECPGIDGARQRSMPMRAHPMMYNRRAPPRQQ